jgi:hypothetical protein
MPGWRTSIRSQLDFRVSLGSVAGGGISRQRPEGSRPSAFIFEPIPIGAEQRELPGEVRDNFPTRNFKLDGPLVFDLSSIFGLEN